MRSIQRIRIAAAAVLGLAGCARAAPPEFRALVLESRARQGEQVLKQVFVLQEGHRAQHGRYAATFDELRGMGWEDPRGLEFYHPPRIVRAQGEELCVVVEPVRPELWAQHVDQHGQIQRGPCP